MPINQTSFGDKGRQVTTALEWSEMDESDTLELDDEKSIIPAND